MATTSVYHQNISFLQEEFNLIEKAKINPQFFAPIYDKYHNAIFRYIRKRVDEEESAQDITSSVFVKALCGLNKFEFRGVSFSSWLFRIAKSELYQSFRDKKAKNTIRIETANITDKVDDFFDDHLEYNKQKLLKSMSQLNDTELQLIEMRYFEKRSFKEIGEFLGITENNAKVKTFRSLQKLRKKFGVKLSLCSYF
jgi:RNA polymerase sigma-70 factor (ECF subfamily)